MPKESHLRLPALEMKQGKHRLYQFAVDGKRLAGFASVSRVHRGAEEEIIGYQRPEALAHIRAIRTYLETPEALMPNALVIAFDSRVSFEPADPDARSGLTRIGELIVPLGQEAKPGFIVDGQQRSAALRDADVRRFPIPVVSFITDDVAQQRSQFILVNATKPLPKGLIHELLPSSGAELPEALLRKRFPATLMEALNYRPDSPFRHLIRTPTNPDGYIKDNSVLKMLENSITDGVLYSYYDPRDGRGDTEAMLQLLESFWWAVRDTFAEAWREPPRRSRLTHGVGIVSLGFVMDAIADQRLLDGGGLAGRDAFATDLEAFAESCAWTSGSWKLGEGRVRAWNELQNTPQDINLLTDYLLSQHREFTGSPGSGEPAAA